MKNAFVHILFIGFLFLVSCIPNADMRYLEKADQFYRQNQMDSMVHYFFRVDSNEVNGEAYYTYQRLFLSHFSGMNALENNLHTARLLEEHYRQRQDTALLKKIQEIYYILYFAAKEYKQADSIANIRLADAIRRNDTKAIRKNYFRKHQIHTTIRQTDSARYYLDKSLMNVDEDYNPAYAYYSMAEAYRRVQRTDEQQAMLDSALVHAKKQQNEAYIYYLLGQLANLYSQQGAHRQALETLQESHAYRKRTDVAAHYMYRAQFHELMHQLDSAAHYYELVTHTGNLFLSAEAASRLASMSESKGADSIAFRRHQDAIDRINAIRKSYDWQAQDALYRELQLKSEIDDLKIDHQQQIIISLSLVFTLVCVIAGFGNYYLHKKRKEAERMAQMERERVQQAEEINRLQEKANRLREELIRRMDVFKKLNTGEQPVREKEEGDAERKILLTETDWKEIKTMVDSNYEGFSSRLKQAFPSLTKTEIHFCCLVKLGITLHDLSNIYCISRNSVSRKKLRLKEKLQIPTSTGISLDEFLMKF